VLSKRVSLCGLHALGEAKVRTIDFNSPRYGDECVTKGGQVTWIDIVCFSTTPR